MVFDVENGFGDHGEIAFEKQVVDADDGAGERVFYWSEENVGWERTIAGYEELYAELLGGRMSRS